jgi:uncharacterized protein YgiM (DUF1202 family)
MQRISNTFKLLLGLLGVLLTLLGGVAFLTGKETLQDFLGKESTATAVAPGGVNLVCAGSQPTRLTVGGSARVTAQGDNVRVRADPGTGQTVTQLTAGTVVAVVEGPRCTNSATWYKVRTAEGSEGWISEAEGREYMLEPA